MRSRIKSVSDPQELMGIKAFLRQTRTNGKTVEQIRKEMDEAVALLPGVPSVQVKPAEVGSMYGEWLIPIDNGCVSKAIVYYHGGGFTAGSCSFYRSLGSRIASAAGVPLLMVDYRLAPEHPYPAANRDCLEAYRWLLARGYRAKDIIMGGDSVGASLALMTMLTIRDDREMLPAGAFLLSPHTDLVHLDGESYKTCAESDPTGSLEGNRLILEQYWGWGGHRGVPPAILSPLRMDLSKLPPMFIQVGDQEVLLSDAERFAGRAEEAGTDVALEVWENMWCVFQMMAHMLPEAQEALSRVGAFVRGRLGWSELQ